MHVSKDSMGMDKKILGGKALYSMAAGGWQASRADAAGRIRLGSDEPIPMHARRAVPVPTLIAGVVNALLW